MPKVVELNWTELNAILQFNVSCVQASQLLGVSADFIEKKIRAEHDMTFTEYRAEKQGKIRVLLQQKAIQMGLAGNATMLIFSLKNLCGWSDKVDSTLAGEVAIKISTDEMGL